MNYKLIKNVPILGTEMHRGEYKVFFSMHLCSIKCTFSRYKFYHKKLFLSSLFMEKDHRYKALGILLEAGFVEYFSDLFTHVPKSVVARDLGTNNMRMSRLMVHPDQLSIEQINILASIIGIDPMILIKLIYAQLSKSKQRKK